MFHSYGPASRAAEVSTTLFASTIRWLCVARVQVKNSKCSVSLNCLKFKIPGLLPGIAFSLLYLQLSDVIIATHPNLRN